MKKIGFLTLTLVLTAALLTGCGCTNQRMDNTSAPTVLPTNEENWTTRATTPSTGSTAGASGAAGESSGTGANGTTGESGAAGANGANGGTGANSGTGAGESTTDNGNGPLDDATTQSTSASGTTQPTTK